MNKLSKTIQLFLVGFFLLNSYAMLNAQTAKQEGSIIPRSEWKSLENLAFVSWKIQRTIKKNTNLRHVFLNAKEGNTNVHFPIFYDKHRKEWIIKKLPFNALDEKSNIRIIHEDNERLGSIKTYSKNSLSHFNITGQSTENLLSISIDENGALHID